MNVLKRVSVVIVGAAMLVFPTVAHAETILPLTGASVEAASLGEQFQIFAEEPDGDNNCTVVDNPCEADGDNNQGGTDEGDGNNNDNNGDN